MNAPQLISGLSSCRPSLLGALLRSFGVRFGLAGLLKLVHDLLQFASPVLLRQLIQYLKHPQQPLATGIALAAALLLSNILQSLCIQTYFQLVMRSGLHVSGLSLLDRQSPQTQVHLILCWQSCPYRFGDC